MNNTEIRCDYSRSRGPQFWAALIASALLAGCAASGPTEEQVGAGQTAQESDSLISNDSRLALIEVRGPRSPADIANGVVACFESGICGLVMSATAEVVFLIAEGLGEGDGVLLGGNSLTLSGGELITGEWNAPVIFDLTTPWQQISDALEWRLDYIDENIGVWEKATASLWFGDCLATATPEESCLDGAATWVSCRSLGQIDCHFPTIGSDGWYTCSVTCGDCEDEDMNGSHSAVGSSEADAENNALEICYSGACGNATLGSCWEY